MTSEFARFQSVQSKIHDPYPLQSPDFIAEISAHSPDLPVKTLGENNAETVFSCFFNYAFPGNGIQDGNAL